MATIGDIMKAKGIKLPDLHIHSVDPMFADVAGGSTDPMPEGGHETPPKDKVPTRHGASLEAQRPEMGPKVERSFDTLMAKAPQPTHQDIAGAAADASAPAEDDGLAQLKRDQAAADLKAEQGASYRRVEAGMSQGARSPDQIQTSDLDEARKRPLQMYEARMQAKKLALQKLLESAQIGHLNAQTNDIPLNRQQEAQRIAETGRHNLAGETETAGYHKGELESQQKNRENQLALEGIRQKGDMARFKPYEVKINPITGEQQIVNTHTGQVMEGGGFDETMRPVYEQYQAKRAGLSKDLESQQAGAEELPHAIAGVKAHPESFNSPVANFAERMAGRVGMPEVGSRIGAALRGEEGTKARTEALNAAAARIHEIAGTRGFSKGEQAQMASLTVDPSDSAEMVQRKLATAEELNARALARTRGKLPVNIQHPQGGGQPKHGDVRIGPNGKKQVWVED